MAEWKVLELNRNFPQSWINNAYAENLKSASFGVDLLSPMEDYQKSTRSAKYALMTIGLTFLMFFLVEVLACLSSWPLPCISPETLTGIK